jgi:hypothetical protein
LISHSQGKHLEVLENRVLREYSDLSGKKWQEVGEDCTIK